MKRKNIILFIPEILLPYTKITKTYEKEKEAGIVGLFYLHPCCAELS